MRTTPTILLLCVTAIAGCVPNDMHVSYGLNPKSVDDDVRFRTTYYFRTFDYCWDAGVKLDQLGGDATRTIDYRKIIPQTDTLYRYRMTGKASALFNRVRFESGVLRREQIDPFGSQVSYSEAADGFWVRDRSDVKRDAERAQGDDRQLARIDAATARYKVLPDASAEDKAARAALFAEIVKATQTYLGQPAVAPEEAARTLALVDTLKTENQEQKNIVAALRTQVAAAARKNELAPCPIDGAVRKGFQIMGPEGLKTFDQDDRLLMAMSNSAKPLIETLQEYSGRILDTRVDTSAQLLALARENGQVESARRAVADARRTKAGTADLFSAVNAAFPEAK